MKTGIIIFSRMSSIRLPGKALIKIGEKKLIEHVIDRSYLISNDPIILATSNNITDDILVTYVKKNRPDINIFRGDLLDVRQRAIDACQHFGLTSFLRVCGDRPLLNIELSKKFLSLNFDNKYDLITNNLIKTYPPGLTVELISLNALIKTKKNGLSNFHREHITSSFYENEKDYLIYNHKSKIALDLTQSLTVDNESDIEKIKYILSKTNGNDMLENLKYENEWTRKSKGIV